MCFSIESGLGCALAYTGAQFSRFWASPKGNDFGTFSDDFLCLDEMPFNISFIQGRIGIALFNIFFAKEGLNIIDVIMFFLYSPPGLYVLFKLLGLNPGSAPKNSYVFLIVCSGS